MNDKDEQEAENGCVQSKKVCEEWVNFSSFLARCFAGGVYHKSFNFNCPIHDVDDGLKEDVTETTRAPRTCRIMVAARYMILASRALYDALIKYKGQGLGLEKWEFWARRLKEIGDKGDYTSELKIAAKEAREKMISNDPTLFFLSEGGTKPSP